MNITTTDGELNLQTITTHLQNIEDSPEKKIITNLKQSSIYNNEYVSNGKLQFRLDHRLKDIDWDLNDILFWLDSFRKGITVINKSVLAPERLADHRI